MTDLTRRSFMAGGLGLPASLVLAAERNGGHPLAPRPGHHPAKAKNLVIFFMTGGMSHVDTFDFKPRLYRDAGKKHGKRRIKAPLFNFRRYGESGHAVSDIFPEMGGVVDDLCFIHSIYNESGGHSKATLSMHTGSVTFPRPSLGAWVSYGLGTRNTNLPPFVVFAKLEPYNAHLCWGADFIPSFCRGVRIIPPKPIPHLVSPVTSITRRDLERRMLRDVNEGHLRERAEDGDLRSRIANFGTAYGLMEEAPRTFDISGETDKTLQMYGIRRDDRSSFGWQCLVTRRLIERGVRVVELFDVGSNTNWDNHSHMYKHRGLAQNVDRPIAGLIRDLKRRGLLEETLIVGMTEFGRTPWEDKNPTGRSHHAAAFTTFLAGGGVRKGMAYGKTDDLGAKIVENRVHVNDFHGTILHLMGLDHTQLVYRYSGRDYRLTDVGGKVIRDVIA